MPLCLQASADDEKALRSALSSAGGVPDSLVAAYKAVLTDPVSDVLLSKGVKSSTGTSS
jgi:hypothetical protein